MANIMLTRDCFKMSRTYLVRVAQSELRD